MASGTAGEDEAAGGGTAPEQPPRAPGFEYGTDGPKVILAGVDGSDTSLRALAYAGGLARRQNSELLIVYVSPTTLVGPLAGGMLAGGVQAALEIGDEVEAELRRLIASRSPDLRVRLRFERRHGDPFTQLVAVAAQTRADAVVVGASTRSGHRLVGSLAVRLVRAGKWPVTVVP